MPGIASLSKGVIPVSDLNFYLFLSINDSIGNI